MLWEILSSCAFTTAEDVPVETPNSEADSKYIRNQTVVHIKGTRRLESSRATVEAKGGQGQADHTRDVIPKTSAALLGGCHPRFKTKYTIRAVGESLGRLPI